MSQLDDLLARSRSPGSFVERRKFTLSRDKAIEKQREFALRHPSQYVLELIQAAVFAGATYMAIDARSTSILVAWVGGKPFKQRELQELLDYLFADRTNTDTRHLVQLAVGVNAILQRKPHTLRIETGDGKSSVRVDLDHNGNGTVGLVTDPISGTYLFAEFGSTWFQRFLSSNSQTDEQKQIEERCLYTPVPILLNGRAPFGYRGSRHIEIFGARHQAHFDADGRRGVVAQHSAPNVTGYRMVVGGVWVSSLPLPEISDRPLVGVICDDGLRKTADHGDIVQDWRYSKMLHAVQPFATAVIQQADPRYTPPRLDQVVEPTPVQPSDAPTQKIQLEPLPDPLWSLNPRAPVGIGALKVARRSIPDDSPLFWCTAEASRELQRYADPHRFGFPLFVLTPGQAATLERELPGVPLHRIASRADVDFIRRAMERRANTRTHSFLDRGLTIELTLYIEGDRPLWGPTARGVPFCAVADDETLAAGAVQGVRLLPTTSNFTGDLPVLGQPLHLPGVSLKILEATPERMLPDDRMVDRILSEAWHLALPATGEPHRPLLAALLGQVAIPRLIGGDRAVGTSLPMGHPEGLRAAPLAIATDGSAVTLTVLEALIGTAEVVELRDAQELRGMSGLEERLGYGHLWHAELAGKPAWGVGYVGNRWIWLDSPDSWRSGMTQVIFVGSTFRPRLGDREWHSVSHPHPCLVHAVRSASEAANAEAGWELLYRHLAQLDASDAWSKGRHPLGLTRERARAMGRLALYHLTATLDHADQPLFLPTDGGARRSLRDLRSDPHVRLVARHGVQVSDPFTVALTADERAAVETETVRLKLRYDDPPEVWTSLTHADTGWLVRQQVKEGGVTGWLGLRHPYDATTGLLVRATGRLVGIPDLDRKIPCHGLLWPDGEARVPTPEQEQLLQLAGLRLYQGLVELLGTERDPDKLDTARRYAMAFVLRSWTGDKLPGTARELARRVEVRDADGSVWGTLDAWLGSSTEARPALPDGLEALLAKPTDDEPTQALTLVDEDLDPLVERLSAALALPDVRLFLDPVNRDGFVPVTLFEARSNRENVSLGINRAHRLVPAALASPGRARELLLLECARRICAFLQTQQRPVKLAAVQQKLVAQRLGTH